MGTDRFVITEVVGDKKQYLPLLLIGDESESMIDRYIDQGRLYVGFIDNEPVAVCVTIGNGAEVEVKNLAVLPEFRCHGCGRRMLRHVERLNPDRKNRSRPHSWPTAMTECCL